MIRFLILLMVLATTVSCAKRDGDGGANLANGKQGEDSEAGDGVEETSSEKSFTFSYESMVAALELSDEEKAKLKAVSEASEEAYSIWKQEKGKQFKELKQQMKAAARARDFRGLRRLTKQAAPLRDEVFALMKQHKENVRNALSKAKQLEWDAHRLSERLLELTESLKLSEEQIKELRTKAVTAAKAAAKEINPQAAGYLQLERSVERTVLTDEQREAFEAIKKKNRFRSLRE